MNFYYRKIEVNSKTDYYHNHLGYYLLHQGGGTKTYAFLTADARCGIPLDDWEIEEVDNMRKNRGELPVMEEEKEEEEETPPMEKYKNFKEAFNALKEKGFFETYDNFDDWKRGERSLKKFRDGEWVD